MIDLVNSNKLKILTYINEKNRKNLIFIMIFFLLNISAASVFAKDVSVEWDVNNDADYYVVYWGENSGNYSHNSENIDSAETQYTISNLSDTTTWYFSVKAFNACGNSSDFSDELICSPKINLSCSISTPTTEQSIMAGESINFQGNASGGSGQLVYAWNFGGSGTGNQTVEDPGNIIFSIAGTYTVIFTVTDEDGDVVSDTVRVNVASDTIPSASISSPLTEQSIMVGSAVNFQGNASGGNGTLIYTWDFDGGANVKTVEDPGFVVFSTAGTYIVSFKVTDSDGDIVSDTIKINVASDTIPAASIISPTSEISIMTGNSVNFQGNASGGNAPLSYHWDFDGGATDCSVEDPGNTVFNQPGTYEIAFTVTDSNGDVALNTVIVKVASDTVPSATIVNPVSERKIMTGGTVNFQGYASGGNFPLTYHWNFDGAVSSSSTKSPGNVIFQDEGLYVVSFSVTDADGDVVSDTVTIVVEDDIKPVVSIVTLTSQLEISAGDVIDIQGNVTGGNMPLSYLWDFDGIAAQKMVEDPGNISFETPGMYTVSFTVTDSDGDVVSDSITVIVSKNMDMDEPDNTDQVYPDGDNDVSLTPELHVDTVENTRQFRWQVSTDLNFSNIIIDILKDSDLSFLKVPRLALSPGSEYFWRFSKNNTKSGEPEWSESMTFTTTTDVAVDEDSNGVFDIQEIDDSVDVDSNGITDLEQDDIKCVRNIINDSNVIGIKKGVNVAEIELVESIDYREIENTKGMPDEMPAGLIGFRVKVDNPGDTAEVVVCFSEPAPENAGWFKYDSIDGWQNYTKWALFSQDRKSVTITLTDGGIGDADGIENGVIIDPGGLGILTATLPTAFSEFASEKGCFIDSSTSLGTIEKNNTYVLTFIRFFMCCIVIALARRIV